MSLDSSLTQSGDLLIEPGKNCLEEGVLDKLADDLESTGLWIRHRPGNIDLGCNFPSGPVFKKPGDSADQHLIHLMESAFFLILSLVVHLHPPEKRFKVAGDGVVLDMQLGVE